MNVWRMYKKCVLMTCELLLVSLTHTLTVCWWSQNGIPVSDFALLWALTVLGVSIAQLCHFAERMWNKVSSAFYKFHFFLCLSCCGVLCFITKPRLLALVIQIWLAIWIQPSCYVNSRGRFSQVSWGSIWCITLTYLTRYQCWLYEILISKSHRVSALSA